MSHIISWLFTDPQTAGANTASGKPEVFHYYVPWIIFCSLGLVLPAYYWLEGRRRLFGSHTLHKYLLDKFMTQIAWIAFVGWFAIGARWALDGSLFSYRFWRYAWALWFAVVIVRWLVYMIRKYPTEIKQYRQYRTQQQYMPLPKSRRTGRTVARAR